MAAVIIVSYDGTANDDDALALGRMLVAAVQRYRREAHREEADDQIAQLRQSDRQGWTGCRHARKLRRNVTPVSNEPSASDIPDPHRSHRKPHTSEARSPCRYVSRIMVASRCP